MKNIINKLIKLNKRALQNNEVPISAIVVKNGKIIAEAINKKNKYNNVLNHAEIIAITKASKKLKTWILEDCDLYITLEPCDMCREVINQSRLKNVYYFAENKKVINYKTQYHYIKIFPGKYFEEDLKNFFEMRR